MIGALLLASASICASYTDLASRRVPNALTFGLAVIAIGLSAFHGLTSLGVTILSYVVVLIAGTIPFGKGWIGGGDVKLLAAGAACAGWPNVQVFLLVTGLAGGVLALAELARAHRLQPFFLQLCNAALAGDLGRRFMLDPERRRLPYALAIAAGALYLLASETIAPWLLFARA